jgi:serine/threonine-protein kinase
VHQAGFVHRDAHPGNIMIQPNGKAVLIDFGIAKNIIPATRSSTNNAANLSFAPYEQIYKGSNASREPNVDVYSLAATFYYAVTGRFPTPSMERRLDNRPLIPPQQFNRQLSGHINDAIVLGMALEKENRPQSMLAWLQQLDLSPPAVSIQYQKEIINPSQVFPKTTRKPPQSFLPKQKKKFPWGWLIALFVFYSLVGLSLALGFSLEAYRAIWTASFWSMSLVLGIASALFFTITAGTRTPNGPNEPFVDSSWLIPCLIFFFPFMFWGMSSNYWLGRIYIYLVMIPLAFMMSTWIQAMQRLLAENFRPSHRFLIIATTNFGGLGFGLLLGLLMRR